MHKDEGVKKLFDFFLNFIYLVFFFTISCLAGEKHTHLLSPLAARLISLTPLLLDFCESSGLKKKKSGKHVDYEVEMGGVKS